MPAYAHSRNAEGERHDLATHLQTVAELTRDFAAAFDARELGYYLGLWHDLGKFHEEWQTRLLAAEQAEAETGKRQRVGIDHKAAGVLMLNQYSEDAALAALVLQGHHGGLKTVADWKSWFVKNQQKAQEALQLAQEAISDLVPSSKLKLPAFVTNSPLDPRFSREFLLRMLLSSLVDADVTDTQRHKDATLAERRGSQISLATLWARLEATEAAFGPPTTPVNEARAEIYAACLRAASEPPGLFRLTVPTGGGKTLSGMAFALRHALQHGMERVIVAVPYMTITEQTTKVYRDIFERAGENVVLEHHSGAVEQAQDGADDAHSWQRLAAENWDAPIVVTTTVQLFESLFANRTARCRKLHRIARSVIILDEAQTLPVKLLTPIIGALKQLSTNYGTSVVLSTATQPAWEAIPTFHNTVTREIVPEPERFFATLKRVAYDWSRAHTPMAWEQIAELLRDEPQALVVLNTKADALALLDALNDPGALHLSTLLCGAHRRRVIEEVTRRLDMDAPCRLISTQVVEAGVDLDFPLVLRAMGPLDSIIQAAGRANREGRLPQGRVVVFETEKRRGPPGDYKIATQQTRVLLGDESELDPQSLATLRDYFELYFSAVGEEGTDVEEIQLLRKQLNYPEIAKRFRLIDQETVSVVVSNYGTEAERRNVHRMLDELRRGTPRVRLLLRRLQPYMVSLYHYKAKEYWDNDLIVSVMPDTELEGLGEWVGKYDVGEDLISGRGLVGEDRDLADWVL